MDEGVRVWNERGFDEAPVPRSGRRPCRPSFCRSIDGRPTGASAASGDGDILRPSCPHLPCQEVPHFRGRPATSQVRRRLAGGDSHLDCILDRSCCLRMAEVIEQQRHREQQPRQDWLRPLPACLGADPWTGSNIEMRPGWSCRGGNTKATLQGRSEVGEDVAEHVVGDDHFKLLWFAHHLHRHRVNEEVAGVYVRVLFGNLEETPLPQIVTESHDVGFVRHTDLAAAAGAGVVESGAERSARRPGEC